MDVKLPHLGEGADSGTVINVLVKEGDRIEQNQPLLELENEKAVATIPSTAAGVVSKLHVKNGDKISAGQRIVSLAEGGGAPAPTPVPAAKPARSDARPAPVTVPAPVVTPPSPASVEPFEEAPPSDVPVAAAPSLRRTAAGTRHRSHAHSRQRARRPHYLTDVRDYIQRLTVAARQPKTAPAAHGTPAKPVTESIDFSRWGEVVKKPLSPLRKVIARRMAENWNTIPHVTSSMTPISRPCWHLRKKYVAAYEKQGRPPHGHLLCA